MDWFCVVFITDLVKLREDPFPQFLYVFSGKSERCSCRVWLNFFRWKWFQASSFGI
ncbi:hypothetical protein OIU79_026270 [Salix purpurea]|uniref:Uncharacterized protein n=1 Tax=Salix purpurea TaxID=77065 RepID=A0A9Q1A0I9_SALPP|nr:hypothetical protein OIU79_026270 [Salix purpurea]